MGAVTLVLGGQKSGKSSTAARLAAATACAVTVMTPAEASDDEMAERIARHKRDRPAGWHTQETFDLHGAIEELDPAACVIVDALDTWLAQAMGAAGLWTDQDVAALGAAGEAAVQTVLAQVDALAAACQARRGPAIIVAGQPGLGLHPNSANGRRYVDLHGLALQRLGRHAEVLHVSAGKIVGASPLSWTDRPAPSAGAAHTLKLAARVTSIDQRAAETARSRHDQLAKPQGSLGMLEALAVQLAGIAGRCPAPVPQRPALLLAAADHGVHVEGVSAWPQEVTAAIVGAAAHGGAVCRALADYDGVRLTVLDVGVIGRVLPHASLLRRPVKAGTGNLRIESAMSEPELSMALDAGAAAAMGLINEGADLLLLGDMGIANTTASACLVAAYTGADASAVTGRGAGADDATLARKTMVVQDALRRVPAEASPLDVLAEVGGLEHAALAGAVIAAAERRVPVLLDGLITQAAALAAVAFCPQAKDFLVAAHQSSEPASALALAALELTPLLRLDLRLGEGSGALAAWPVLRSAAVALRDTALLSSLAPPPGDSG